MTEPPRQTNWATRAVFGAIGLAALVLGVIGIFLPLLPTTPLILLSAACFAKASPRAEAWLLRHKAFGPMIRDWRTRGAISRRGKIVACVGMALGFILFLAVSAPPLWLIGIVFACLFGSGLFVVTRPQ